jgi:tRNA(adenine34) deaminase
MPQDEQFMSEAIMEAELAAIEGNWPMGCVLVLDGQIIARAHNTGYTDKNRMAHAEVKALTEAKDILEAHRGEVTLFTTYEPCPMCFGAIVISKLKRVVTGIDLDESGCLSLQNHLPPFFAQSKFHFEITRGVLADECKTVYLKGKMIEKHKQSGFLTDDA